MQPLNDQDPESRSPDLVAENIERLKALFPKRCQRGEIDFEVLKQLLGGAVDEREEKCGMNWTVTPRPTDRVDAFHRHPTPVP